MSTWLQQHALNIIAAFAIGWLLWRRFLGPRMAGVRSLSAEALLRMRKQPHVVIDVRTPTEWAGGHPKGAVLMPLAEIDRHCDALPKDRPLICICASGMRSAQAAKILANRGFSMVYNFAGGFPAWRAAGLPVARGDRETL